MHHHVLFFDIPFPTEISFRGAILQSPRLHFCRSQQNNLKEKNHNLATLSVINCIFAKSFPAAQSRLLLLTSVPCALSHSLISIFCKCYKMGSDPSRLTHTSLSCRAGCKMQNSPHRGLPEQKQMLSEIWGFVFHEKPRVPSDSLLSTQISGIRGR